MFTGLIEDVGRVKSIEKRGAFGRISVEVGLPAGGIREGDSIAVNGVCLTATAIGKGWFTADVSSETLRVTTLGELSAGSAVNIELALTLNKPLGGHMVTGHADGVGVIRRKSQAGENLEIEVGFPRELAPQIVRKGSIAVDGISLTVAELGADSFRVAVIPHTLKKTNLLDRPEGARVNLETDIIGKYVERHLAAREGRVSEDFLREHGFLRKG